MKVYNAIRRSMLFGAVFALALYGMPSIVCAMETGGAYHETLRFDPSQCATDPEGMVYFSLGRLVFRLPATNLTYIIGGGRGWKERLPLAAKPSEPEGCPGHPMQGTVFQFSRIDENADSSGRGAALSAATRIAISYDPDGTRYGLDVVSEMVFDIVSKSYHTCSDATAGLRICWGPGLIGRDHSCIVAEAVPSIYSTPDGIHKFATYCLSSGSGHYICDVFYKISKHVNVSYKYHANDATLSKLLPFDKNFRSALLKAELPNYVWAASRGVDEKGRLPQ